MTKNAAYSLLHVISAALSLCQVDPVEVLGRDKTDWILGVLHSLLCDRDTLVGGWSRSGIQSSVSAFLCTDCVLWVLHHVGLVLQHHWYHSVPLLHSS